MQHSELFCNSMDNSNIGSISNQCERKSLFDPVNSTNKINDKHNRANIAFDGLTSRIKDGRITKKNALGLFFFMELVR